MAAVNSTRASGITVEHCSWGLWVRGKREPLIQHGYAQNWPFPGDPGVKKNVCDSLDQQGRAIRIRRASKTTFWISRGWVNEEKDWYDRREAQKAEVKHAARMREEEIQRAHQLVNSWPKTGNAFRETAIETADFWLGILEKKLIDGESGGWRYDDATSKKIEHLVDQMIELIKAGAIVEDIAIKEKHTPACIAAEVLASEAKLVEIPRYTVDGNIIRLGAVIVRGI